VIVKALVDQVGPHRLNLVPGVCILTVARPIVRGGDAHHEQHHSWRHNHLLHMK
jgi:hypothetical protein